MESEQRMSIKTQDKKKVLEVKKRCTQFDEIELLNLITIYSMPEIQNAFKMCKRHSLIYEKIANLHNATKQYSRSGEDVKNKLKNLKSEYTKKKPKSGGSPPDDFPLYSVLHQLWSEKDVFNDELLDDSMTNNNLNGNDSDEQYFDDEECESSNSNNNKNIRGDDEQKQVPRKNNKKVYCSTQRKISCRSSRNIKSDESRLIELLIQSNADDTKRLQQIDDRQKRAKERDIALNASLKQFLDIQISYMKFLMGQKTSSNSPQILSNDILSQKIKIQMSSNTDINNEKESEQLSKTFSSILPSISNNKKNIYLEQNPLDTCTIEKPLANANTPLKELETNCKNKKFIYIGEPYKVELHLTTKKRELEMQTEVHENHKLKKSKKDFICESGSSYTLEKDNLTNKTSSLGSLPFSTQVLTKSTMKPIILSSQPMHNIKQYKPIIIKREK